MVIRFTGNNSTSDFAQAVRQMQHSRAFYAGRSVLLDTRFSFGMPRLDSRAAVHCVQALSGPKARLAIVTTPQRFTLMWRTMASFGTMGFEMVRMLTNVEEAEGWLIADIHLRSGWTSASEDEARTGRP